MPDCSSTTSPILTDECAKSRNFCDSAKDLLPPYLNNTEPLEPEDIPLQVALLTMEMAALRQKLSTMSEIFAQMAQLVNPDLFSL